MTMTPLFSPTDIQLAKLWAKSFGDTVEIPQRTLTMAPQGPEIDELIKEKDESLTREIEVLQTTEMKRRKKDEDGWEILFYDIAHTNLVKERARIRRYAKQDDEQEIQKAKLFPISELLPGLKIRGNIGTMCCPIHHEKTASFKVDLYRNTFYCFGCKAHGDAIDLYMQLTDSDFNQAIKHLS